MATEPGGEDDIELQLQRIILPAPAKLDQKSLAQRLGEAENVQANFSGCKTMPAAAAKLQGARHENLGERRAASFTERDPQHAARCQGRRDDAAESDQRKASS